MEDRIKAILSNHIDNADSLEKNTVLIGSLVAIAMDVAMETGCEIILNEGDTFGDLMSQISQ